jgi:putative lipoprotein (rSAM/lipoprotein system)
MKYNLLSRYNKILFFFIGVLGFSSSCEKKADRFYGTPYAKFSLTITGFTKSINSRESISNIKVSLLGIKTDQQGAIIDTISLGSSYSDNIGQFVVAGNEYSSSFIVSLRDIDSTKNGSFKDKDTAIILSRGDFEDVEGELEEGKAYKYLYFYLEPKP